MAGIALSEMLGPLGALTARVIGVPPVVALVLLAVWAQRGIRRPAALLLLGFGALGVGFTRHQIATARPAHHVAHVLGDRPVLTRVSGRIITAPVERPAVKNNPFLPFDPAPRTQFVIALDELRTTDPPAALAGRVRVSVGATGLDLGLGRRVQLTGRLYRPSGPRNPGEHDWSTWYRFQGICAGMHIEDAAHLERLPGEPLWHQRLVLLARSTAGALLLEPYADVEGEPQQRLLSVMVLGQRSAADRELNEAFLRAGGMHFLAVSGFHVGVLAGVAWWLLRRVLRQGTRIAAGGMLAASLVYALVAEPNAPVLRATTMVALLALAMMCRRPVCVLNWLALAAACVLLINPLELFRAGFHLSFVQVVGLVTVVPAVGRLLSSRRDVNERPGEAHTYRQLVLRTVARWTGGLVLVCICAYLVALPLVLLHFGRMAPWGWLGTLLLSVPVMLTIVVSFATLVANAVLPWLAAPLVAALHWLTATLLWIVGLFREFPAAVIERPSPPVWLVIATYGLVLLLVVRRRVRPADQPGHARMRQLRLDGVRVARAGAGALLALAWVGWWILPAGWSDGSAVHVLAVGDGSTTLITAPHGKAAVYDVGTMTNTDAGLLAARGLGALGARRVEMAIISHANFDHYSGLPTLMERVPVERWLANPYLVDRGVAEGPVELLLSRLPGDAPRPETVCAGDHLSLGSARLEVLWPPRDLRGEWRANDRSLVVRMVADGRSVLLTGDIDHRALRALVAAEQAGELSLRADVLVAPHHGAVVRNASADFYAAVSPQVVVVSAKAARERLEKLACDVLGPAVRVLTTGEAGAVSVRLLPGGNLRVERFGERE